MRSNLHDSDLFQRCTARDFDFLVITEGGEPVAFRLSRLDIIVAKTDAGSSVGDIAAIKATADWIGTTLAVRRRAASGRTADEP